MNKTTTYLYGSEPRLRLDLATPHGAYSPSKLAQIGYGKDGVYLAFTDSSIIQSIVLNGLCLRSSKQEEVANLMAR